ncbi:transketolase [Verminephrobacter eiseniae]|uniref:transketolase n=1 Tax=Verminephrobacter eiseniae TaxID=364317 RepID=UPI002236F9C2|nr:transketolase [Verminephrobacter eiseniae]MCW5233756.1 transketolase [Verminephrobacter eiseniae]MCW5294690.1 transketolase [Verminephrobacter eiseniae]
MNGSTTPSTPITTSATPATPSAPDIDPERLATLRATALNLRRHMLAQARGKGQGYLGQGLGIADFLAVLYFDEFQAADLDWQRRDRKRFYLSTGHNSIALWAAFAERGLISQASLPSYGADGSPLEMSTMQGRVPGVEMTGGSLGHGLGIAAGAALGYRLDGHRSAIHVEISDGELQEGSTWEGASIGAAFGLDNLVCWIDCNGIQADGPLVVPVEPVAGRFAAFGWDTAEIDGNDLRQLLGAFAWTHARNGKPKAVVLRTRPGCGIRRVQQRESAHFVRVEPDEWDDLARELEAENA